jgi:hypothetical protein
MASWKHLTTMLPNPNRLSKAWQVVPKTWKTSRFLADNESVLGNEREKQFFKNERTKLECL